MKINVHVTNAFFNANRECLDQRDDAIDSGCKLEDAPKLLVKREFTVFITASGRGQFPVDQLRRYQLFPTDGCSAMNLIEPEYHEHDNRNVELCFAHQHSEVYVEQCAQRFASFGWSVSRCQVRIW